MKQLAAILLAFALMTGAAFASGDVMTDAAVPENFVVKIDLDGDGAPEALSWEQDAESDWCRLTVESDHFGTLNYTPPSFAYNVSVFALDLDGDGVVEILMSGDAASDDYYTECLHYQSGALTALPFADGERGENGEADLPAGYGAIIGIEGRTLTLCGTQDVLGTWFADRDYALTDGGRFAFASGEWVRDIGSWSKDEDEEWDYAALTTTAELPYTGEDGQPAALTVGARLLITASDKQTYARFVTRDGVTGTLSIAPDLEQGWGMLVNGFPESEWFETIPYAD